DKGRRRRMKGSKVEVDHPAAFGVRGAPVLRCDVGASTAVTGAPDDAAVELDGHDRNWLLVPRVPAGDRHESLDVVGLERRLDEAFELGAVCVRDGAGP